MSEENQAFVTLATTDAYCMGSLVVGKCLRKHGTTRKLVVMVTPNISTEARLSLEDVFDEVIMVDMLDSRDIAHLCWLGRPELGITLTKLHCWTLTQYNKCVFLDADTLVLCNVDELFEREEFSAAPDPGWPDCFNSGVFVFRPSLETHSRLLEHAKTCGSFDGGDQGLLNTFFSDWAIKDINKHLPFIYNLSCSAVYTYLPAFHKYGHQARIIHFLGRNKPWNVSYEQQPSTGVSQLEFKRNLEKYVNQWWAEYYSDIKTQPSATSPATPYPHIHELVSQAEDTDEKVPSESVRNPTSKAPSSSTIQQLGDTRPTYDSDIISAEDLEKSEFQEPPVELKQEEDIISAAESALSEATSDPFSDSDIISAADSEDLEKSEFQEPPVELKPEEDIISGAESALSEATSDTVKHDPVKESLEHRKRWEEGHIDYMGKDAFENIRIKLDQFLS